MGSAVLQGLLWGRAAQDWAELHESIATPLWEALLDAAAVGGGTRLLDAGCGAGGASVLAAERGASVNGLDAATALVWSICRSVPATSWPCPLATAAAAHGKEVNIMT